MSKFLLSVGTLFPFEDLNTMFSHTIVNDRRRVPTYYMYIYMDRISRDFIMVWCDAL